MRSINDGITSESRYMLPPPPPPPASTQTHYTMHSSSSSSSHVETIKQEYGSSTYSYSYTQVQHPPALPPPAQHKREEYYYPVYNNKQDWSEGKKNKGDTKRFSIALKHGAYS